MRSSTLSVLGLAMSLAGLDCQDRGEQPQRACPPAGAADGTLSFSSGTDVAGTRDEAWAVGDQRRSGSFIGHKLLHWDGCDWQVAPSPLDDGRTGRLSAIWSNGRDVWLSGIRLAYNEGAEVFGPRGHIHRVGGGTSCGSGGQWFRRRGDGWEAVAHPGRDARDQFLIAGKDENDLWMLERGCGGGRGDVTLVHWNGKTLDTVAVDAAVGIPTALWPAGGGAVWLSGDNGVGRWDGRAWRAFPFGKEDGALRLAGGGPSDLWAFGRNARHWNGTRWSEPLAPATPGTKYQVPGFWWAGAVAGGHAFAIDGGGGIYRADGATLSLIARSRPWGEWLAAAQQQWRAQVVGADELVLSDMNTVERPALRWKRGAWAVSPTTKLAGPAGDDVVALWNDGAGAVWAAVSARVALGARAGEIRRYDGHAWIKMADIEGFPSRFAGTAPDDVWLVGLDGWTWHFAGRAWQAVPTGVHENLLGVWAAGRDEVWAGGTGGTVLNWNGRDWRRWSTLGATDDMHAVKTMSGTRAADIWASGGSGRRCLVHWDGVGWSAPERGDAVVASWGGDCNASGVWMAGAGDGWLIGAEYIPEDKYGKRWWPSAILLHWDGQSWTRPADMAKLVEAKVPLNAIAGSGTADVWVVGDAGTVLRWDGKRWARGPSFTNENLNAVAVQGSGGAVWVGGAHGVLQKLR